MKPYGEVEMHDALVSIYDGMPIRHASRTWHIPERTLRHRLVGKHSGKLPKRGFTSEKRISEDVHVQSSVSGFQADRPPHSSTKSDLRSIPAATNTSGNIFIRNKSGSLAKYPPASGRAEEALRRLRGITWAISSRISRPAKRSSHEVHNIPIWQQKIPPDTEKISQATEALQEVNDPKKKLTEEGEKTVSSKLRTPTLKFSNVGDADNISEFGASNANDQEVAEDLQLKLKDLGAQTAMSARKSCKEIAQLQLLLSQAESEAAESAKRSQLDTAQMQARIKDLDAQAAESARKSCTNNATIGVLQAKVSTLLAEIEDYETRVNGLIQVPVCSELQ